jgi:antitoxin component YwqK of YwqJK toxin-antitoxin module
MRKNLIVLAVMLSIINLCCAKQSNGLTLEFVKSDVKKTKLLQYELRLIDNDRLIAKRVYYDGKIKLSEGGKDWSNREFANVVIARGVIESNNSESKPIKNWVFTLRGKTIAEIRSKNGTEEKMGIIPDGLVIERYEDGNIRNISEYKNGKRNGAAISLYQDGKMRMEENFSNGLSNGYGRIYYENGRLMIERETLDGKEMASKYFTKTGSLYLERKLTDGKEYTNEEYYSNGKIKALWKYTDDKEARETYRKEFNENGAPVSETYLINESESVHRVYNEKGKIKAEWRTINGQVKNHKQYE